MVSTAPAQFDLKHIVNVLFKHKNTLLSVWLVCFLMGLLYAGFSKPVYEATASILIKVGRENIYVPPPRAEGATSPIVDSDIEAQMNSEVEILKSRVLAEQLLDTLTPAAVYPSRPGFIGGLLARDDASATTPLSHNAKTYINALVQLQKNLKMEGIKKSNVIKVSFRHTDPAMAAKVLNTLTPLYFDQHLKVHQDLTSLNFFSQQNKKLKDDLENAENAFNSFKKKYEIVDPEEQKKLLLAKQSELRAELAKTEHTESETQARVAYYKGRSAPTAAYLKILESLIISESELKEAQVKKPILLKQVENNQLQINRLGEAENEFHNLQQQVELCRQNLRLHQANFQEVLYKNALDKDKVSNVSLIDPAWPPVEPVTPKLLLVVLSFVLGAIAGLGLALFREYADDRINTPADVENSLDGLPLLGIIPYKKI